MVTTPLVLTAEAEEEATHDAGHEVDPVLGVEDHEPGGHEVGVAITARAADPGADPPDADPEAVPPVGAGETEPGLDLQANRNSSPL